MLRKQEIGISWQTITPEMASSLNLARNYGVIVSDVWPGGPAAAAGMKIGDILVSMDGMPADNLPTVVYNFRLRESSDHVQLKVLRDGTEVSVAVKAVEDRSELDAVSAMADPEKSLVQRLGILGVEIDQRISAAATGLRDPDGIIVVARAAGAASEVPLLPRDVIRAMNGKQMASLQVFRGAVAALPPGTAVTLQIQREGRLMYISFTLD
jgi:serine protease Do